MIRRLVLLCLCVLAAWSVPATAHEVRPAYFEITETRANQYEILWKQPVVGEIALHLVPHLSSGWLERAPRAETATSYYLVKSWHIESRTPVSGQTFSVEGLEQSITDVLVRVNIPGQRTYQTIIHPEQPSVVLALSGGGMAVPAYLILGIEHILTGVDHLAFVLGLLLIVRDRWMLLKTVSAFTLAHSLTLAAATLGLVSVPVPLLNALIALSILFVAPEIIRARQGGTSLMIRYPWIVAFAFGLLHGMGFANGLAALGFEKGRLFESLLLFNVGVEVGQVAFIALILALRRAFRLMEIRWLRPLELAPTYAIGALGASWTIQYCAALFGGL
jgi:hydrogenase/urease accessory protein HupE